MIYNRDESEVAVLGDVQKFKVSIDEKNINHIVTILSSNLYSNPLTSFLRETVSNAVDSHIEAGTKEPIIITISKDNISIRDYGTGISPERFQEIYLNIGSSTKRESNNYIGSFGIGRFSCLSVSPIANITSFYNGKAYYYVMNKDIDQLHIDLLFEKDTDEANGVEVKVPYSLSNGECFDCLKFIDNVYINNTNALYAVHKDAASFNGRKVYKYKNFKMCNLDVYNNDYTKVLVGDIPYVVDYKMLFSPDDNYWYDSWKRTFTTIFPCVKIGEVDVTPNRESLLYSDRTIRVLKAAYDRSIEELTELFKKQQSKEFTDFGEYIEAMRETYNVLKIDNSEVRLSNKITKQVILKGRTEWLNYKDTEIQGILNTVYVSEIPRLATLYRNSYGYSRNYNQYTFSKKSKRDFILRDFIHIVKYDKSKKILLIPSLVGTTSDYFKSYVTETYGNEIVFLKDHYDTSKSQVKALIVSHLGTTALSDPRIVRLAIQVYKELLKYIKTHSIIVDIVGSAAYQQYKKDNMVPKNSSKKFTGDVTYYVYNTCKGGKDQYKGKVDNIVKAIRQTYPKHYRIVYAEEGNPFIDELKKICYPRLLILTIAKTNMKHVEGVLPSYIRPVEELYSEDNKTLQRIVTINSFCNTNTVDYKAFNSKCLFPAPVQKDFEELKEIIESYMGNYFKVASQIFDIIPPTKYDKHIIELCERISKYFKIIKALTNQGYITSYSGVLSNNGEIVMYFLMKDGIVRPSYNVYKRVKDRLQNMVNNIKFNI